jgi:hypothetical protein
VPPQVAAPEVLDELVGVPHRRLDGFVPKKALDVANIGPVGQQVRRAGVPQIGTIR